MMTADMDQPTPPPGGEVGATAAPPPSGRPGKPPNRTPSTGPVRRVVTGIVVGSLTMFGVATLDTFAGATVPVLGSIAEAPDEPAEPEVVELPPPPSTPGTCLNWTRADAADTDVVDCDEPHLFEQAGSVLLLDQTAVPDDDSWRQLVDERCTPVVVEYLDGAFDPVGKFRVGALRPSPTKWEQGERELRCGLQSASRSGALYPITGRVADQDQSNVHEPGTCLAIDGRTIGDPIDCDEPHAVEAVGIVDLSEEFAEEFPSVEDQDAFLQPECARIAGEYAGGEEVIAEKELTVYWDNLADESWEAGSRRINCNLAALLPDKSGFAPVTGSVMGPVSVSDSPAPPATGSAEPGTPVSPGAATAPGSSPGPASPGTPLVPGSSPPPPAEPGSPPPPPDVAPPAADPDEAEENSTREAPRLPVELLPLPRPGT